VKTCLVILGLTLAFIVATYNASPWPSALVIRVVFEAGGRAANRALAKHVPPSVTARLNERYDPADPDALLDVYFPSEIEGASRSLPTIVWVHGGGFVSGSKDHISNYLKILAGKGYTAVGVDYSLAPRHIYPTPLRQVNAALAHLVKHAQALHVDASRIVLAGDSAGAHISAQIANIITSPEYANAVGIVPSIEPSSLSGTMLYCGPYDVGAFKVDGALGWFMTTVLWSYSGKRNHAANTEFVLASVPHYVTPKFPPTFISAGNGDPLLPHSVAMADALAKEGVRVDRLFFAQEHTPSLPHEYQVNLDSDAGKLALARSLEFLSSIVPAR
jgi:acetyl esterase/lipase